jgi:hypothetical protein
MDVKSLPIGALVYNVWAGLYLNEMVETKGLEKALLEGNLPE